MDSNEIANRFSFHPVTPENGKGVIHEAIRDLCGGLAAQLNDALPEGREKSLAITHLEEVMMWSNAAVARSN